MATICCMAGLVHLEKIQAPPGPLYALVEFSRGRPSHFLSSARDYGALLSFASIGRLSTKLRLEGELALTAYEVRCTIE